MWTTIGNTGALERALEVVEVAVKEPPNCMEVIRKINVRKALGTNNGHRAFIHTLQCARERRTRVETIG